MKPTNGRSPTSGGGYLSSLLFTTTSILVVLYFIVIIHAFLSIPDMPSDLFSRSLNPHPMTQNDLLKVLKAEKEKRDPYRFPQTIADEVMEEIDHPGVVVYNTIHPLETKPIPKISVPRFWAPPGGREALTNGGNLMSRDKALSVGSKVQHEGMELETIFAAIASYRDWQCPQTVESIFSRAKYPQRLRVAINDQRDDGDDPCIPEDCTGVDSVICKFRDQIDVYTMEAQYAIGPVFARHIGHRLYRGEYFTMQLDAHVDFVNDWDVDIVTQWKSTNNEMAVLSAYLSDITGSIHPNGDRKRMTRPIMCESDFEGPPHNNYIRHGQQPEGPAGIKGTPTLEPYWAAGFSFARGHFVVNIPYDQHLPMIFQGEEINIGLRGFTYGYDYYTPERSVCFHWYAHGDHVDKRKKVRLFWEHSNLYKGVGQRAMHRVNGIIKMNHPSIKESDWDHTDEDKYGLGKVRKVEKFFKIYGIHMDTRTVEHHLCRFTGKQMQSMFIPHMRHDKMGIDYDKIHFEWRDPQPNVKGRD